MPVPPPHFLTRSPPKYATYIHPGRHPALEEMKRHGSLWAASSCLAYAGAYMLPRSRSWSRKHVQAAVGAVRLFSEQGWMLG